MSSSFFPQNLASFLQKLKNYKYYNWNFESNIWCRYDLFSHILLPSSFYGCLNYLAWNINTRGVLLRLNTWQKKKIVITILVLNSLNSIRLRSTLYTSASMLKLENAKNETKFVIDVDDMDTFKVSIRLLREYLCIYEYHYCK